MAWRVDKVQLIALAVQRIVVERDALRFDRDASLALDIEVVENLLSHFPLHEPAAVLNKAVGKCGFAVVDMGDDREITYMA